MMRRFLSDESAGVPGYSIMSRRSHSYRLSYGQRFLIPSGPSQTFSNASTVYRSSYEPKNDTWSRKSSASTVPSSISSVPHVQTLNQQIVQAMQGHIYAQVLPCEFTFIGCDAKFPLNEIPVWIEHSLSHFHPSPPPPKTICIFCDEGNAVFAMHGDPFESWSLRMNHIADHLQARAHPETRRPDYFLLDYLLDINRISREDYIHAIGYTERPHCDDIVGEDFVTPEMEQERLAMERMEREPHDLQKERREMRNEKRAKEKGTHKTRHSEKSQNRLLISQ